MPKAGNGDLSYVAGVRALLLAAGLGLSLGACHSGQPAKVGTPSQSKASTGPGTQQVQLFSGLHALAQRQRTSPDTKAQSLSPLPGVDPAAVAPLAADMNAPGSTALASVESALANFASDPTPPPPDHTPNPQALRLYVSGRAKLVDGDAAKAVTDLEAATRLDPAAAEPWRELGEAQLELGRRTSAMASYQKAVKLGLDEPRLLDLLAREALRAKKHDEAAKLLVQARESKSLSGEPGLEALVDVDLADTLDALGYLTASRDLLAEGLLTPIEGIGQSQMRAELTEMFRRRGDLWQRVGDLSCRLGQYEKAATAYANAAQAPTLDPGAIIARRVYAYLRLGRSAEAALVVIDDIGQSEGRVEERQMGVITFLAHSTEVGPKLAEAIEELSHAAGAKATPTVLNRLARASAAGLSGDQARTVLTARLAKSPFEADLIMDLLLTRPADEARGRVADLIKLIQTTPLAADTCAAVLIIRGQGIDASTQLLEKDRTPAARLLDAALLTRLARPVQALQRLDGVEWPPAILPVALALKTSAAVADANWALAGDTAQALANIPGHEAAHARIAALQAMQQFDQALEAVAPLVSDPAGADLEDLLTAGDLALRCEHPQQAEGYFNAAVATDRFDERAYEALISIYALSGPISDETKLTTTARALRQSISSSRTIRGISAQDLVSRSLWPQAEAQLLSMVNDGNENPSTLNLLVTVWERAAAGDPELTAGGERWLRTRLADRPDSTAFLTSLARVLVAQGKGAEADALLTARLAVAPLPEVARRREWVVREGLDKPDEADQLTRARLAKAPKTIDNSIELAELLVRSGEVEEAAQGLTSGLPDGVRLTNEQATRLVAILPKIKPEALVKRDPALLDVAIKLFDLIAGRGAMTPQMHLTRLTLLATGHPDETDRLISAIDDTAARHPEITLQAYGKVADALNQRDQPGPMLHFLAAASNHINPPNEDLLVDWFTFTYLKGEAPDIEHLVTGIKDPDRTSLLLKTLFTRMQLNPPPEIPDTLVEQQAEIARYLGDFLTSAGRDALAETAYRQALKLKPDHAWSANNLGYQILDSGGDIDEAERLINIAFKQIDELENPNSVVDSMGWVRYKRGILKDVTNGAGEVIMEGAVTLLTRAADEDSKNPVIMDHAADALWRAGEKDKARELWLKAETPLKSDLDDAVRRQLPEAVRKKYRDQFQSVRAKRTAADKHQEPPVAPLAAKKDDTTKPISTGPGDTPPKP